MQKPFREVELLRIQMYIVYILLSQKYPEKFYIGFTKDLKQRLAEHNSASMGYSKRYAPWKVETHIVFSDESLARNFEKYLKAGSGHAFLKRHLISPKLIKGLDNL